MTHPKPPHASNADHDEALLSRRQWLLRASALVAAPSFGSLGLIGCGGGDDALADTPRLASVDNFRDIAGNSDAGAYKNTSGKTLRRGLIYRSNNLSRLSDADKATLEQLKVATVYDLRTPDEIGKNPDRLPAGANYVKVNIFGDEAIAMPAFTSAAVSIKFMEDINRSFITSAVERQQIGLMIRNLATTPGVQLYHCTAGKDRAGWITVVLQTILGMSEADILKDYLLTNTYSAASIAATYETLKAAYGQAYADAYKPLLGVQESFLKASYDQIKLSFGSMESYLSDGLKLEPSIRSALRDRLLYA